MAAKIYPYAIAHRFSRKARTLAVLASLTQQDPVFSLLMNDFGYPDSKKPDWIDVVKLTGSKPIADDCAFFARDYDDGKISDVAAALSLDGAL